MSHHQSTVHSKRPDPQQQSAQRFTQGPNSQLRTGIPAVSGPGSRKPLASHLPLRRASAAGIKQEHPPPKLSSHTHPSNLDVKGSSMHPAPATGRHTGPSTRTPHATAGHQAAAAHKLTRITKGQSRIDSINPRFATHNPVTTALHHTTNESTIHAFHTGDPDEFDGATTLHETADSISAPWQSSCSSTPVAAKSIPPSITSSSYPTSHTSDFPTYRPQHFPAASESSPSQDTPLSSQPSNCLSTPQSTITHSHTGFSTRHRIVRDWQMESCSNDSGESTERQRPDLTTPSYTVSSAPDTSPWLRQPDSRQQVGSPKKILFEEERQPQALRMQALKVRDRRNVHRMHVQWLN